MSVNVKTILKSPLAVGACITAVVAVTGTFYAIANQKTSVNGFGLKAIQASADDCKTIVFDDKPPLNVRATPIEKTGNVVGSLQNGDVVTVIGAKGDWLQINAPVVGWIYKNLTRRDCASDAPVATLTQDEASDPTLVGLPNDSGSRLYLKSLAHFQAGNLNGAIALARAVPVNSAAYPKAQTALKTMPQAWSQAKTQFSTAQQAEQESRWSDILKIAMNYPDIRYWRERLTPIVKKASQMQHDLVSGKDN
jgi:uncharacterized protein YgiM (DUF1202 family)